MDYFFAVNSGGGKFAGPFQTYEEATKAAASAPAAMRPAQVEKAIFCADVDGKPCPECSRVTAKSIERVTASVAMVSETSPKELHQ